MNEKSFLRKICNRGALHPNNMVLVMSKNKRSVLRERSYLSGTKQRFRIWRWQLLVASCPRMKSVSRWRQGRKSTALPRGVAAPFLSETSSDMHKDREMLMTWTLIQGNSGVDQRNQQNKTYLLWRNRCCSEFYCVFSCKPCWLTLTLVHCHLISLNSQIRDLEW